MIQKTDNLKEGDLVCILLGWSHQLIPAIYIKSSNVSITYYRLINKTLYQDHIRTRNSTCQRVFKITEDNLSEEDLAVWRKYNEKISQDNAVKIIEDLGCFSTEVISDDGLKYQPSNT